MTASGIYHFPDVYKRQVVSSSFESYAASMSNTYGQFGIEQVAQQQGMISDSELADNQQNTNATLDSLKSAMDSFCLLYTSMRFHIGTNLYNSSLEYLYLYRTMNRCIYKDLYSSNSRCV